MRATQNFLAIALPLALSVWLLGCAKPVPAEKASYVGTWHGAGMELLISEGGSVAYKRQEDGVSKSVDAPLKEFEGDNFVVGLGPMTTTFIVSAPPHQEGEAWQMTVDGVVLTKEDSSTVGRPRPAGRSASRACATSTGPA